MPGVERLSIDLLVEAVGEAVELGIPAVALFPVTDPAKKTPEGEEAVNPENLVCRAVRAVKAGAWRRDRRDLRRGARSVHQPRPGRAGARRLCGERRDGRVLCRQAVVQAEAGCDVIAPSDMMDGRVGAVRRALDEAGFDRREHHGLRGQVCVGVLRAVPRRGRLGGQSRRRRQADLPDGPGQHATKRCAKWRSTSPKGPTW